MNPLQRYVEAASGVSLLTRASANKIVKGLLAQGLTTADNAADAIDDLVERSRTSREHLLELVASETRRVIGSMGLASKAEVERLRKQLASVERELAAAKKKPAKRPVSKPKTTKKKAAKKTAKRRTSGTAKKKASSRTSATKNGAKKKTATRPAKARKSVKKTTTTKKTTKKKTTAKKK